jgi:hypothetical protein
MKKLSLSLMLILFGVPGMVQAAPGDACTADIVSSVPDTEWSQALVIKADDGGAWERAIMSSPRSNLMLKEDDYVSFNGVATPGSEVQLFLFHPEYIDGQLRKPAMGTCLQVEPTNEFEQFSLQLHSRVLWPNLGTTMIADAYYKVHEDFDQYMAEKGVAATNNDFFIGTNVPVTQFEIDSEGEDSACTLLCDSSPLRRANELDPAKIRQELLGNNLDDVGLNNVMMGRLPGAHTYYVKVDDANEYSQEVLQKLSMKAIGMENLKRALMGTVINGGKEQGLASMTAEDLVDVESGKTKVSKNTQQLVKYIKAALTGEADRDGIKKDETKDISIPIEAGAGATVPGAASGATGTTDPVYRQPQGGSMGNPDTTLEKPLEMITAPSETGPTVGPPPAPGPAPGGPSAYYESEDVMIAAAQYLGGATRTGKKPLPKPKPKPSTKKPNKKPNKDAKPRNNNNKGNNKPKPKPGGGGAPKPPPPPISREEGLKGLEEILNPGDVPALPPELIPQASTDDQWAQDFILLLEFWTGSSNPSECMIVTDSQILDNFEKHDTTINPDYQCRFVYTNGLTPGLLLNTTEEMVLEANHTDIAIKTAETPFSSGETWYMPSGLKTPINYTYETSRSITAEIIAESCIAKNEISEFGAAYQQALNLTEEEREVLEREIYIAFQENEGATRLELALGNPNDIAKRFGWIGNNEKLDILQLFFTAKPSTCQETTMNTPQNIDLKPDRDGFEAGLLS